MVFPVADNLARKAVRIMVVDDVDFNREILTFLITERGWQVVAAASGEAALDLLAQDTGFDIILMDLGLPGIDGLETTRRIKQNSASRAIPIIAITAETVMAPEILAAAGLDGYVAKNFDPEQLFAAIEHHISTARRPGEKAAPIRAEEAPPLCGLDFETLLATYADEESLARIAKAFFADTAKAFALLEQAMAADEQVEILACCHSLSGSAAIFTARELSAAAEELAARVRAGEKPEAVSAWRRMLAAHGSLHGYMARRLNL